MGWRGGEKRIRPPFVVQDSNCRYRSLTDKRNTIFRNFYSNLRSSFIPWLLARMGVHAIGVLSATILSQNLQLTAGLILTEFPPICET